MEVWFGVNMCNNYIAFNRFNEIGMSIGEPKLPTTEEMAKMQKSRVLSDADFLNKGAQYVVSDDGTAELYLTEKDKNTAYEEMKYELLRLKDPKRYSEAVEQFIKEWDSTRYISKGGDIDRNGQLIAGERSISLAHDEMDRDFLSREMESAEDLMTDEQNKLTAMRKEEYSKAEEVVRSIWDEMYALSDNKNEWNHIAGLMSFVQRIKSQPEGEKIMTSSQMQLAGRRLITMTEGFGKPMRTKDAETFISFAKKVKEAFSLSEEVFKNSLVISIDLMLGDRYLSRAKSVQTYFHFSPDMLRTPFLHRKVLNIIRTCFAGPGNREAFNGWSGPDSMKIAMNHYVSGIEQKPFLATLQLMNDFRETYMINDEEFNQVLVDRFEEASLDPKRADETQILKEVLELNNNAEER